MKLKKFLLAGGLSASVLVAAAAPASDYIVCNRDGDCWHADRRIMVPGVTFTYHPDDWYFHRHWDSDRDHHWRGSWLLAQWRMDPTLRLAQP
ncbi:MAG TPA: hypothetical protein VKB67_11150 [Rhizomicrobium sp.]|nr:hypothetical protein [Rhizomicrobium sp.]